MNLEKQVLNFMKKKNYIPLTKEELAVALNISFNSFLIFKNYSCLCQRRIEEI